MKHVVLILLAISISLCFAERGITNTLPDFHGICVGTAQQWIPESSSERTSQTSQFNREEWVLVDSLFFNQYVHGHKMVGAMFNGDSLDAITLQFMLISEAQAAIEKAPLWARQELTNIFVQLDETSQFIWAEIINSATDPYIDEIAFSIAHSSVAWLQSQYSYTQLIVDNAQMMYQYDTELNYVNIVDYGSSTDEDYYSTTSYAFEDSLGVVHWLETPRDIYYWYLVHPKITDEVPSYINPITPETPGHLINIEDPPIGVFWRDYLYNFSDVGYPVLRDSLLSCPVLWGGDGRTAMNEVHDWVNETMTFTSDYERRHQPVRIYKKHIGRCGEHADLTAAAARSALIPCTSILTLSGDHTWDEFWCDRWITWEPVSNVVDDPMRY
ncbi:MAG: hypothetical protein K8S56_00015 [Candidatus Cloacimonetes bacterium]|nr:hypothetical protein [Candidatus Cloacimonadota bacterium]